MLCLMAAFVALAISSYLPPINGPIEYAFIALGMRDSVCGAYLAAMQSIRNEAGGSCSSTLFAALVVAIGMLVVVAANLTFQLRKRAINRADFIAPAIFTVMSMYLGLEVRSGDLDATNEWTTIASFFFLGAAITHIAILLIAAQSKHKPHSI